MPKHSLILIGYRGTGKTTLGHLLAKRLGLPFFDSDRIIARRAGKTIAEIFAQDGEARFRDLEEAAVADILQRGPVLLSSGGGAILREGTRLRMRRNGIVIWLTVTPETAFRRIGGDPTSAVQRPGLTSLPPLDEIRELLKRRTPLYRETADWIFDTETAKPAELANSLIVQLSSQFPFR